MKTIQSELADAVEFVKPDDERADAILVVAGCPSACTKLDAAVVGGRPVHLVTSPEEARRWARDMRVLAAQHPVIREGS